jgi:hypothetical protein
VIAAVGIVELDSGRLFSRTERHQDAVDSV